MKVVSTPLSPTIRRVALGIAAIGAMSCADGPTGPKAAVPDHLELVVTGTRQMASIGDSITVTVRVLDAAGRVIAGVPVGYEVTSPAVLQDVGSGAFRSIGNGTAYVIAALPFDVPHKTSSGTVLVHVADSILVDVHQVPAAITIAPVDTSFWSLGYARQLTALLADARGNAIADSIAQPTWLSVNSAVATVDAAGRVLSVGDGSTKIRATANSLIAELGVRVAAHVPVSRCVTYQAAGATVQRCANLELVVTERP